MGSAGVSRANEQFPLEGGQKEMSYGGTKENSGQCQGLFAKWNVGERWGEKFDFRPFPFLSLKLVFLQC